MANRGHALFRGLCTNAHNHHFSSIVRLSGSEAVASTNGASKRKRTDSSPNILPAAEPYKFEKDIYSCLFDENNRCTIFDLDEPSAATNVSTMEMSSRVHASSESTALTQVTPTPIPTQTKRLTPLPEVVCSGEYLRYLFAKVDPMLLEREILSVLDPVVCTEDKSGAAVSVPTMETKRCKLSPSRPKPSESLTQVSVTETPPPVKKDRVSSAVAAPTSQSKDRMTKNDRERRRRAEIKLKFMKLHNLCCSKAVSRPNTEAKGLLIPISGVGDVHPVMSPDPSKVHILGEAIQALKTLRQELIMLRTRNRELKMNSASQRIHK